MTIYWEPKFAFVATEFCAKDSSLEQNVSKGVIVRKRETDRHR